MKINNFAIQAIRSVSISTLIAVTLLFSGFISGVASPAFAQTNPGDANIQQAQDNQGQGLAAQQDQNDATWLWWLLPLIALGVLFLLLRQSIQSRRDEFQQFHYRDDQPLAGVKGGQVERRRDNQPDDDSDDLTEDSGVDPWDRDQDDWNIRN